VIRGGAIGDFILTLPVLAALRRRFPASGLEVLGQPAVTPLAVAGGLADAARSLEEAGWAGFFVPGGALEPGAAGWLGTFDLVVSYLLDSNRVFESNVRRCTRARVVAGRHRPGEDEGIPAAKVFLGALGELGVSDADPVPRLSLSPGGRPTNPILAIHPGSGGRCKNWPEDRWGELLPRLAATTRADLLLVGGEAEEGRLGRLKRSLPPGIGMLADGLPLVELGRRLAACSGFLGHDSGISHLAAALGVPCVLLWGPSREQVWRPPQPWVRLVHAGEALPSLGVSEVLEAVRGLAC
jgi:heptosyltransferase III